MAVEPLKINTSELKARARELKAGGRILLSGTVYTARDAAHKRIQKLMEEKKNPPVRHRRGGNLLRRAYRGAGQPLHRLLRADNVVADGRLYASAA